MVNISNTDKSVMKKELVAKLDRLKREVKSQGLHTETLRAIILNLKKKDKPGKTVMPHGENEHTGDRQPRGQNNGQCDNKAESIKYQKKKKPATCIGNGRILQMFRLDRKQGTTKRYKKSSFLVKLSLVEEQCQLFPYKTEFETLADVFNISDDRTNFKRGEKPWYIGWSNCHSEVKDKLRAHYRRPYFLPSGSESSGLDWMFMGGSGLGTFIHLDYVQWPSWQAQISGRKTWTLVPVPECESVCHTLHVTVHKGDIFVIDTNQWYHATYIHPGEISITIGSEYD